MNDVLLVFYSRTGTTRRLAQQLADALGADLDDIREWQDRKGWSGFLRSLFDSLTGREPVIAPARCQPRDYRMVIIGTPVWADRPASPVRRYLREHEADLQHVALFCTYGRSGALALAEMADIIDCEPVATLMMSDSDLADPECRKCSDFVSSVRGSVATAVLEQPRPEPT